MGKMAVKRCGGLFYAIDFPPALLSAPSRRKITAATPTTTITVKKSPNVPSADSPALMVSDAVVELDTTDSVDSSASTIAPIPTMIASDTMDRAIGPRLSVAPLSAMLIVHLHVFGLFKTFFWAVYSCGRPCFLE